MTRQNNKVAIAVVAVVTLLLIGLPLIVADQFFIVLAAFLLAVVTYFQLHHTRLGTAMRAMADNPALARASGIDGWPQRRSR